MTLEGFFRENRAAALGFSGGVDSAYLLYEGLRHGADIKAYFVKTEFQPDFELRDARRFSEELGTDVTVIEMSLEDNRHVYENTPDRCYHCKKAIFGALSARAEADGYTLLLDGSNASDEPSDRPGMRALTELSVRSPLRECGITKSELRRLSKEAGLFTWNKPAYACLATRIPQGRAITPELLRRIDASEEALFSLGFTDFRVRLTGEAARIQLPPEQMPLILEKSDAVKAALKPYFTAVLLDLEGRV